MIALREALDLPENVVDGLGGVPRGLEENLFDGVRAGVEVVDGAEDVAEGARADSLDDDDGRRPRPVQYLLRIAGALTEPATVGLDGARIVLDRTALKSSQAHDGGARFQPQAIRVLNSCAQAAGDGA